MARRPNGPFSFSDDNTGVGTMTDANPDVAFIIVSADATSAGNLASRLTASLGVPVVPGVFALPHEQPIPNYYSYWAEKVREDALNLAPPKNFSVLGEFLDNVFPFADSSGAAGISATYDELRHIAGWQEAMEARGVRVIHLVHANALASLARVAGGAEKLDAATIASEIAAHVAEVEEYRRLFARRFTCLELCLGAMEGADDATVGQKLVEFLGLSHSDGLSDLSQHMSSESGAAEDKQVAGALSGTDFEHMVKPRGALPRPALRGGMPLDDWHSVCSGIRRAEGMLEMGRTREAQILLTGLRRSHPDEPAVAGALGCVFEESGDIGRSVSMYRIALHLDPMDAVSAARLKSLQPGAIRESVQ